MYASDSVCDNAEGIQKPLLFTAEEVANRPLRVKSRKAGDDVARRHGFDGGQFVPTSLPLVVSSY